MTPFGAACVFCLTVVALPSWATWAHNQQSGGAGFTEISGGPPAWASPVPSAEASGAGSRERR